MSQINEFESAGSCLQQLVGVPVPYFREQVVHKGLPGRAALGRISCSHRETQSLWKYFGISFCLISLCTVYTFNGQGIIRGALWCGVFLQRALPSANGCGLK